MDPLLEIRPAACLFVLGPQFSSSAAPNTDRLSYDSIIQAGVDYLREFAVEEDVRKLLHLKEGDHLKAMQTITSLLRKKGLYQDWISRTFSGGTEHEHCSVPDSVLWLLELHRLGSMLACTQYDTILDSMAGLKPAVMTDEQSFAEWLQGGKNGVLNQQQEGEGIGGEGEGTIAAAEGVACGCGFLHLHGIQTVMESISTLPYSETGDEPVQTDNSFIPGETLTALRHVFQNKLVFLVGFDGGHRDPLLPSFLELVYPEGDAKVLKNLPILLTSRSAKCSLMQSEPVKVLQLRVCSVDRLREVVLPGEEKNFSVGKEHADKYSDGVKVQMFLLFNEKQSFRKLGDIIYQQSKSGEIYVRRDALTVIFDNHRILYGNLVTYGGNGLRRLWDLVFAESSTLLGKGLVALGIQSTAIVWLNKKPKELGNITGINSVHTSAAHKAVHTIAMAQQLTTPTSSSSPATSPSKPPPFFTPVSVAMPTQPVATPTSEGQDDHMEVKKSNPKPVPVDVVSSTPTTTVQMSTFSNLLVSPPSFSLPAPPQPLNPLSYMLFPSGLAGTGVGGQILTPQYVNIPPAAAAATPGLAAILPPQAPFLFSPTSLPLSLLPTPLAPQPSPVTTPQVPMPRPQSTSRSSPHHVKFGQTDLEALTNIQNQIKSRLSSVSSDEEVSESSKTSSLSPTYSMHAMQRLGPELVLVSPTPVARTCRRCLVKGAEILNSTPEYLAALDRALAESEITIQRIDSQSRDAITGSGRLIRRDRARGGVVTAVAAPTSTASLSTVVKFTNTAPRLSLIQGSSNGKPRPFSTAGSTTSPLSPLVTVHSPLSLTPPGQSHLTPPGQSHLTPPGQSHLTPLAVTNYQPPAVIPVLCPPQPLPPSYFILPTSTTSQMRGANVLMGGLNPQQLSALMTGAGAGYPPGGLCIMVSNTSPLPTLVSSTASPSGSGTIISSSLPVAMSSTTVAAHQGRGEVCVGTGSTGTKLQDRSDSKRTTMVDILSSNGTRTSGRKRPADEEIISVDTKALKLASSSSERSAPKSVSPQHIRNITTNQNHPRWLGGDSETTPISDEKRTQQENGTAQSKVRQRSSKVQLWQFLLDLLLTPNHASLVQWTGRENEFKVVDMPATALLWRNQETPDPELSTQHRLALADLREALDRCYAIHRVAGKEGTFKFLIDIQRYIINQQSSLLSKVRL